MSLGVAIALAWALAATAAAEPSEPRPAGEPALDPTHELFVPRPEATDDARLEFRAAVGGEWDTNARRSVQGAESAIEGQTAGAPVADGLTRLVAELRSELQLAPGHTLELGYLIGAKRFFARGSEDLLAHNVRAGTFHALTSALSLSGWGTLRASRIRSGLRDYSLAAAGLALDGSVLDTLGVRVSGTVTGFDFDPDAHFSYWGPTAGAEVAWRPASRVTLSAHVDHTWRLYTGNGLVSAPGTAESPLPRITWCDPPDQGCTAVPWRDRELAVGMRAVYRGKIVVGAEYLARIQRSTSQFEEIDRHRFSVFATAGLPLELTANVLAALQINSGVSVNDTRYNAEDDENQNSVQVQLSRRLGEGLSAELRWALFKNQFTTADVSFLRQTIYLGLAYRIGS